MCYTIKIEYTREELERRFGGRFSDPPVYNTGPRISAFTLPQIPVICSDNPLEIRIYRWGLIPFWVKNTEAAKEIRLKTFNARSESLVEKASFRHCFGRKHCLVLVNGFYEWQSMGKSKIPFYIGLKVEPTFALAGLYDHWKNPETGETERTFTIITTRANPMMEEIHNVKKRMPVILSEKDEKRWLGMLNPSDELFEPFPQENMYSEKLEK